VMSRGEEDPVDARSNEEAWAANRRDEFRITAGGDRLVRPGM
jgi:outer membrane protein OmpA-like peptidoglycan-associated protein